jgi:hypothetical protein
MKKTHKDSTGKPIGGSTRRNAIERASSDAPADLAERWPRAQRRLTHALVDLIPAHYFAAGHPDADAILAAMNVLSALNHALGARGTKVARYAKASRDTLQLLDAAGRQGLSKFGAPPWQSPRTARTAAALALQNWLAPRLRRLGSSQGLLTPKGATALAAGLAVRFIALFIGSTPWLGAISSDLPAGFEQRTQAVTKAFRAKLLELERGGDMHKTARDTAAAALRAMGYPRDQAKTLFRTVTNRESA